MEKSSLKSFLELRVIWKDDDLVELNVIATNNRFFGTTKVYADAESISISSFAQSLIGFPHGNKELLYQAGTKEGNSYFAMNFFCVDKAGHIGVVINLENKVLSEFGYKEVEKLQMQINVESNAIDNFQRALYHMATSQKGTAILFGRDNRLDN